jgi:putative ABC transport system permease protein
MPSLLSDARYAARLLKKTPAFTIVAVATLALGIGANTAIFSVVSAALINPLPFPSSDRLVLLTNTVQRDALERRPFSYPDFRDVRDRAQTFDAIAAWSSEAFTVSSPDGPARQVEGELASASYFQLLGATPVLGRTFTTAEDEERGAHPVAVVSHAFWQRQLGGDRSAAGRSIVLNDRVFTVVGVLPDGFRGLDDDTEVWIPFGMLAISESPQWFDARATRWHSAVARLKPGVTIAQANADLTTVMRQLEQTYTDTNARYSAAAFSLKDEIVGELRPLLLTMLGAVGFVLLIACVNLANLLLARASSRDRETAIRAALGADRRRLIHQFVAEGLLLSIIGGAAGVLLAMWCVDALVALAPTSLPSFVHPRLDWTVLAFIASLTCGVGLLLGLLPALQGSRADLNDVLKDSMRGSSSGRNRARLRSVLVISEVALSLLLLVGAGLMVRSFVNLQRVDVGFHPERAVTMRLALPEKYQRAQLGQVATDLVARLAAAPGVRQVALASDAPLAGGASATIVSPEGRDPNTPDRGIRIYRHGVTPGFFGALGIALVSGRDFDAHDGPAAQPVAIVTRKFAQRAWPDVDPLGKRFVIGRGGSQAWITVVGVAAEVRYRTLTIDALRNPEDPDVYFPLTQRPDRSLAVVASAAGTPTALIAPLRESVQAFDRDIPVFLERTFTELVARRMTSFRLSATVMTFFGVVALLLAAIGVYGLINYSVLQRRQEIGVRVALGAGRREIYGLVLKDALRLTGTGIVLGVIAAIPASRLIGTQLYGVTPGDPGTYAAITALLLMVSIAATLLPARRAARVDPIVALRAD